MTILSVIFPFFQHIFVASCNCGRKKIQQANEEELRQRKLWNRKGTEVSHQQSFVDGLLRRTRQKDFDKQKILRVEIVIHKVRQHAFINV